MMHGRKSGGQRLMGKLWQVNWTLVLLIGLLASIGFAMLYSAANGNLSPWASRQMAIFAVGLVVMLAIGLVDIRFWLRHAYWPYGLTLAMLAGVEILGKSKGGARRWLDLEIFQLQPSEFVKFTLVLALARYFHRLNFDDIGRPQFLLVPLFLIALPVVLVQRQPDLGTALFMLLGGAAIFFIAGVRLWKFAVVALAIMVAVPVVWPMLKDYQQERVLTFLSPERDPGDKGYQILQSKIALGSGGTFGRGFMKGTQSHLNFLPERQTDFIFTMLAEEFGLFGGLGLLGLYAMLLAYGIAIAMRSTSQFGRLLAMGVTIMVFLYVFINIAMVMGMLPVVGLPLPLISRGGTAMLAVLGGFGLVISVYVHRDARIGRHGEDG
ncbi:MAG: Rod shape-determining protein RodA [Alphaproteobacteria bacterium MarineAlpha10_Bin3]|jgi:rod shape determining protein RodA|nr:MAG: Rod shape-determining protein RodA [Alphaproteobacteria bacterium MarineAlpha10_Bin3]PPR70286.1 MAG: Rod shape-determining protein RodA [Alphaproteobacteria bacterium MarineAlpha4_Bin1]